MYTGIIETFVAQFSRVTWPRKEMDSIVHMPRGVNKRNETLLIFLKLSAAFNTRCSSVMRLMVFFTR